MVAGTLIGKEHESGSSRFRLCTFTVSYCCIPCKAFPPPHLVRDHVAAAAGGQRRLAIGRLAVPARRGEITNRRDVDGRATTGAAADALPVVAFIAQAGKDGVGLGGFIHEEVVVAGQVQAVLRKQLAQALRNRQATSSQAVRHLREHGSGGDAVLVAHSVATRKANGLFKCKDDLFVAARGLACCLHLVAHVLEAREHLLEGQALCRQSNG